MKDNKPRYWKKTHEVKNFRDSYVPGGAGEKQFWRKHVVNPYEQRKAERKEEAVQELEKRFQESEFHESINIKQTVEEVCGTENRLFNAKIAKDVARFLDPNNPRMFQSKYSDINDASVAVINKLMEKYQFVRLGVGRTLTKLLESKDEIGYSTLDYGAPQIERQVNIPHDTIKERNRQCRVSEDYGLSRDKPTPVPVPEDVKDIQPILEYMQARNILKNIYRTYQYNCRNYFFSRTRNSGNAAEYAQEVLMAYDRVYLGKMPPEVKGHRPEGADEKLSTHRIPWADAVYTKARELAGLPPIQDNIIRQLFPWGINSDTLSTRIQELQKTQPEYNSEQKGTIIQETSKQEYKQKLEYEHDNIILDIKTSLPYTLQLLTAKDSFGIIEDYCNLNQNKKKEFSENPGEFVQKLAAIRDRMVPKEFQTNLAAPKKDALSAGLPHIATKHYLVDYPKIYSKLQALPPQGFGAPDETKQNLLDKFDEAQQKILTKSWSGLKWELTIITNKEGARYDTAKLYHKWIKNLDERLTQWQKNPPHDQIRDTTVAKDKVLNPQQFIELKNPPHDQIRDTTVAKDKVLNPQQFIELGRKSKRKELKQNLENLVHQIDQNKHNLQVMLSKLPLEESSSRISAHCVDRLKALDLLDTAQFHSDLSEKAAGKQEEHQAKENQAKGEALKRIEKIEHFSAFLNTFDAPPSSMDTPVPIDQTQTDTMHLKQQFQTINDSISSNSMNTDNLYNKMQQRLQACMNSIDRLDKEQTLERQPYKQEKVLELQKYAHYHLLWMEEYQKRNNMQSSIYGDSVNEGLRPKKTKQELELQYRELKELIEGIWPYKLDKTTPTESYNLTLKYKQLRNQKREFGTSPEDYIQKLDDLSKNVANADTLKYAVHHINSPEIGRWEQPITPEMAWNIGVYYPKVLSKVKNLPPLEGLGNPGESQQNLIDMHTDIVNKIKKTTSKLAAMETTGFSIEGITLLLSKQKIENLYKSLYFYHNWIVNLDRKLETWKENNDTIQQNT